MSSKILLAFLFGSAYIDFVRREQIKTLRDFKMYPNEIFWSASHVGLLIGVFYL